MTTHLISTVILGKLAVAAISVSAAVILARCSGGDRALHPAEDTARQVISVCEVLENAPAYRGKVVVVRGIYWFGLTQNCPQRFVTGKLVWPSALNLWYSDRNVERDVDRESWEHFEATVKREAKAGRREEIWITVVGQLRGPAYTRQDGQVVGGYGHLGVLPAELAVERVYDIEIRPNPTYDYGEILRHGEG